MDDTQTYHHGDLELSVTRNADGSFLVTWRGSFHELEFPSEIAELVAEIRGHNEGKVSEVSLRFEELSSINSSMMVYLTRFVREIGNDCALLNISYQPAVEFQRVILPLLAETICTESPETIVKLAAVDSEAGKTDSNSEGGGRDA